MHPDNNTDVAPNMRDVWERISKKFIARHGLRFRSVFLTGLSTRIHKNRLSKLWNTDQAKFLKKELTELSPQNLKTLRTYAAINQEQAAAAFRLTLVGNVSIPIALLAILHQLLPKGLGASIAGAYDNDAAAIFALIVATLTAVFVIAGFILYALGNLNQARDIRHLLDLYSAERGIYFGLEDMDDLTLN